MATKWKEITMQCPKCGSSRTHAQIVTETKLHDQHHGCLWWVCVGWWWLPLKWLVFTLPALLIALFKPKRRQVTQKNKTKMVCDDCGFTWNA